ncbi:response regulator transcription factor (plasmid) [Agrobacterium salinitolerans]|uniref:response regulator transcription factor n=1 Tax=Agrobacterium salinitolerans TaxID=1183413 RepID=UPI001C22EE4F|nr:response regulator transcription factor [Agrobacterium salinitolerans]QXC52990.1 response regulator transcription factor [Agrobacterium salinitolerans]
MKKLILIGSIDADFFLLLSHILQIEGYQVLMARGVEEMSHLADDPQVRAVLLDCRPDPFPAVEVCARIKGNHRTAGVPILAIIGAGAQGQYVDLQRAGAEECFVRPFAPIKLLEYLRQSGLSRTLPRARTGQLSHGGIEIDFEHHRVSRGGQDIHLGPLEFALLSCLMERPTEICRRAELMTAVWPGLHHVEERTLNVHIGRLRKRLNQNGQPDPIRTVRGVGYILESTVLDPPDGFGDDDNVS